MRILNLGIGVLGNWIFGGSWCGVLGEKEFGLVGLRRVRAMELVSEWGLDTQEKGILHRKSQHRSLDSGWTTKYLNLRINVPGLRKKYPDDRQHHNVPVLTAFCLTLTFGYLMLHF